MKTNLIKALTDEQLKEIATDYDNNQQPTPDERIIQMEVASEIGRRIASKKQLNHI